MSILTGLKWKNWKNDFRDTFGNKGWAPIKYANAFKYQAGPLLDYALKKEKLLLQVRKSIDKKHLVTKNPKKEKTFNESKYKNIEDKKPCEICEKANKGKRYHAEDNFWFKEKRENNEKTGQHRRFQNNAKMEVEISDEDPKN
ncbi:hypothetical protein PV326_000980 [Microctonus aethiopoides]|nr:hypothetical protein PV326_000980 [Microctonus aethiopoides]